MKTVILLLLVTGCTTSNTFKEEVAIDSTYVDTSTLEMYFDDDSFE